MKRDITLDVLKTRCHIDAVSGCWVWAYPPCPDGFPRVWANGKAWLPHRLAWYLAGKPLPDRYAKVLVRTCETDGCVNPAHHHVVCRRTHMQEMQRQGRLANSLLRAVNSRRYWSGRRKLTEEQVQQIRELVEAGQTYLQVSRQFGVSDALVGQIIRGVVYRNPEALKWA